MAKQRNSLGLCVLTMDVADSDESWEDYKKRTGINLEDIFWVHGTNIEVKPSFSKILVVKAVGWPDFGPHIPLIEAVTIKNGDEVIGYDLRLIIPTTNLDEGSVSAFSYLQITHDKRIKYEEI